MICVTTILEEGGRFQFLEVIFLWSPAHFALQIQQPASRTNQTSNTTAEGPSDQARAGTTNPRENLKPDK